MNRLRIRDVGLALGTLLAVSYVLCVIWDAVFPGWAMYQTWQQLLPGFGWSAIGLTIGLVETVLYGFYVAAVFVPVYNYLRRSGEAAESGQGQQTTPLAHT